jgi:hypothetical protein
MIATRRRGLTLLAVMAGLVPAIHVFDPTRKQDVDARDKRGHDDQTFCSLILAYIASCPQLA